MMSVSEFNQLQPDLVNTISWYSISYYESDKDVQMKGCPKFISIWTINFPTYELVTSPQ